MIYARHYVQKRKSIATRGGRIASLPTRRDTGRGFMSAAAWPQGIKVPANAHGCMSGTRARLASGRREFTRIRYVSGPGISLREKRDLVTKALSL